ncbi:tRNA/rRNA methyltransferase [Bryocella elongata]|uniref:tRNA/rRNA methyltransferase n=1 Tax=Bryocella elongata TaxID=863522 RepID=A0A1H6BGT0_9BACT|nr:RNA methyltransferase [Bryocella elongata]SEG59969.1 tRNA/rRNA methyltransferase [Bryocella elongata]
MLSSLERAHFTVILVGARNPGNIGAAARAMHDLGFTDLRVVNDFAPPFEAAQLAAQAIDSDTSDAGPNTVLDATVLDAATKSAVHSAHVLQSARRYDALEPALEGCTLVVGTTAIGEREVRLPILPLKDVVPQMIEALRALAAEAKNTADEEPAPKRVALLFGSEKTGLTNEQLSHCQLLTTIPMYAPVDEHGRMLRHLSMNLGQSVAVCLYELTREGFEGSREMPYVNDTAADFADRERMTALLDSVMRATDYTRRYPHNSSIEEVRALATQLASGHHRAMTWMGILRQVLRQLKAAQPDTVRDHREEK